MAEDATPRATTQERHPRRPAACRDRCVLAAPLRGTETDRLLATSPNPLIAYMRLHEYAGPGSVPALSEKFLRFLDREPSLTRQQMEVAVEILTEFCQGRRRLASVVIGVAIEGLSYRQLSEELGVSDHTVATIAQHGKLILDALCREAGVYLRTTPTA